ncbi:hypothetical protein AURDEDRAFT_132201, partial [Auricularia subglabra TFB-10046 SS5]
MDGLDRNWYALPLDAALLLEQIHTDEEAALALQADKLLSATSLNERQRALEDAQEALKRARLIHDGVLAREDEIQARIMLARGHFHPIRKLPDEILRNIFLEWMTECPGCELSCGEYGSKCDHVCLLAAAVCRWWRRVALGLRELWRELSIYFGRRVNTQTLHHWIGYLDTHRMRSGSLPLELAIHGDWELVPSHHTLAAQFWTSMQLCFAQSRYILIAANSATYDPYLRRCLQQEAPCLVEFHSDIWLSSRHDFLRLFRSAPLLRRLKLSQSVHLEWYYGQSNYPAVTEADIDGIDDYGMSNLFRFIPNVSSLKIFAGNLDSRTSTSSHFS